MVIALVIATWLVWIALICLAVAFSSWLLLVGGVVIAAAEVAFLWCREVAR